MKIYLLLGVMVAVNGLPTPQELLDRPDPFYGSSGVDSYGGQGNEVEKQGEGGYEEETSLQNDIDTSEKLENDDPQIVEDSGRGYDEVNEEKDGYTDKDDSEKLEDDEDIGSGYYNGEISQSNDSYNNQDASEKLEGNHEDLIGYDEDISQQSNAYNSKDTVEKLESKDDNIESDNDEDVSQQSDSYGNKDTSDKLESNVGTGYDDDISQQNDGYDNQDTSENLEGNLEDGSGQDQEEISHPTNGYDTKDTGENKENNYIEDVVSGNDEEITKKNDGYSPEKINEDLGNNLPSDYNEPENEYLEDSVTIVKDSSLTSCSSFTEDLGYMCVPYYQCSNGTIITDGTGLIDIRNGFGSLDAEDGKCPGILDVCCKDPNFVAPPPKPQPYQASCGRRNTEGLGARILGFKEGESQVGEWPHMCALLREETIAKETPEGYEGGEVKSSTVNHFICGASLIAPGAVLTGAHCVNSYSDNDILKVRCGEWDTQTQDEPYQHQDRYVSNYVVHPGFKSASLHNDVAVLFTTADFVLDHNVDSVCLPEPGETFDNEDCFATGWGKDKFGGQGQYQAILKEIGLPIVDFQQCETSLQNTRLGAKFNLHQSFLCAGGEPGKDTCKGDGGSPLVCPSKDIPNRYVQAGIVAWGIGCGDASPGVYADVSQAVCFIDHAMSCNGVAAGTSAGSHWQYNRGQCGDWIQNQIDDAVSEIPAGTPARILPAIKQHIQGTWHNWAKSSCTVDYVDIGQQFARQEMEPSYSDESEGTGSQDLGKEEFGNSNPY